MEDLNNNNVIMWLICPQISMASYNITQQKKTLISAKDASISLGWVGIDQ